MEHNQNAPTVKPNKGVRFYNPGDRFSEPLNYSIEGYGDIHAVARWMIDAEEKSFFNVPTELRILADGTRIMVDFPGTVVTKFKDRGVIMIDEDYQEPEDDEEASDRQPFAKNEEDAKKKGARLWRKYLEKIVKNHIEQCQRAKTIGGIPMEASGFTRRAFKLLNVTDPATLEMELLSKDGAAKADGSSRDAEIDSIKAQLEATNQTLERVMGLLTAKERAAEADRAEAAAAKAIKKNQSR